MKLQSIHIRNFQSHEDTEIKLHPDVNVIVGKSDVGKSAILRALFWVFHNKPSGNSFMSHWEKDNTSVSLRFEDGSLSRKKEKGFNGYLLGKEKFKGFGQMVPQEISQFLNLNEINLQSSQFDSPFMLSWTPGERGAYINKMVDLEIADSTISNLKSTIRSDKGRCSSLEEDIGTFKEELKKYEYLDEMEERIEALESMEEERKTISSDSKKISYLIGEIEEKENLLSKLKHVPGLLSQIKKTEKGLSELKKIQEEKTRIISMINRILETKETIDKLRDVPNLALSLKDVDKDMSRLEDMRDKMERLDYVIGRLEDISVHVATLRSHIRNKRKKFEDLMPPVCPLCGRGE